jgi:hypothetical protein
VTSFQQDARPRGNALASRRLARKIGAPKDRVDPMKRADLYHDPGD